MKCPILIQYLTGQTSKDLGDRNPNHKIKTAKEQK
jgi:hypothetical protein